MEKTQKQKFGTYDIVFIGVMSAVVFISNFFSVQMGDVTRIHFGNVFCVLSGLLLGALPGGLCAGIGSFFYDLCNPIYAQEAFITFLTKFVLGAVVGFISHQGGRRGKNNTLNMLAAMAGSVSYVILYLGKNFIKEYFIIKNPMNTVLTLLATKGVVSLVNAVIAVVVALLLLPVFQKALERSGLGTRLRK